MIQLSIQGHSYQCYIKDQRYQSYFDKPESVTTFEELWATKRNNQAKVQEEINRDVSVGWTENKGVIWRPARKKSYEGPQGGPPHGPTTAVTNLIHLKDALSQLFIFIISPHMLEKIAK